MKTHHTNGKRERWPNILLRGFPFVLIASIFFLRFLYSPNPLILNPNQNHEQDITDNHTQLLQEQQHAKTSSKPHKEEKRCDLFKGNWVKAIRGSTYYTNSSCTTIPDSKNCFKQGREDSGFLNWKWKPEECDLPLFEPRTFLNIVRGKKMAFIGDSVARNHMDSLLCLLSQEETPQDIYKDSEDRFRKWYFPKYDFNLIMLWSRFLIVGEERMVNGSGTSIFDLQLDKVDDDWAKQLPDLDYALISSAHWFFRPMYLHEGDNIVGCIYCNDPNIKVYDIDFPLRMAFKTSLNYIKSCKQCRQGKKPLTILRTFAPAHFENGWWNTGGYCNRTSPKKENEVDFGSFDWKLRNVQYEEYERVRNEGMNEGTRFEVVDVTKAMMMRPDGHPGEHWGNKWMKGYNDCTHWCLPGPVDIWSELLLAVLKREADEL